MFLNPRSRSGIPATRRSPAAPFRTLATVILLLSLIALSPVTAGLARNAAAELITAPAGEADPDSFATACLEGGGEAITIEDGSGNALETSCEFSDGMVIECNWIAHDCSFVEFTQATAAVAIDPDDVGGVLQEDTPTAVPPTPTLTLTPAGGTILINKHFCPPYAQFDAYSASRDDLAMNCQEPAIPVDFAAVQNGSTLQSGTALGAPNDLTFAGLPTGDVTIIETLPSGFGPPAVHCSVDDEFGVERAPVEFAFVDNDRIYWPLNDGDVVSCDWFNVPEPLGTTIAVVKHTCPDSVGYGDDSVDDYWAACPDLTEDITFKLDGASTGNPGDQLTDSMGQITLFDMEADHYFLTEEVPSNYGPPVVFCATYSPSAPQNQIFEQYDVSSENRIEFDVADGESIICYWFNISAEDASASPTVVAAAGTPTTTPIAATPGTVTSSLTILLFRCPPAPSTPDADADAVVDCTERPDDVRFELEPLDSVTAEPTAPVRFADTGDPETGEATFSGIPPGDYLLTELDIPEGQTAFIMGCESDRRDFSAYPFDPFAVVAADGSLRFDLVSRELMTCSWYETPPNAADLTIQVYDCPGAAVSVDACDPAPGVVSFVLSPVGAGGLAIVVETGEDGIAQIDNLDGSYRLDEVGATPCGVESDALDADGNLTVAPDTEVIVQVFHCA